ncbi:NAD/NADP octopine/nopaline dehydrogenase family protein [bacterium]|nr:NAD/NADP octopine/nopaline dehydrogenase family protein [bacterium]
MKTANSALPPLLRGTFRRRPYGRVCEQKVGIVGAGNSAHALACYLVRAGRDVHLYARRAQQVEHLLSRPVLRATGKLEGSFSLAGVCTDAAFLARNCSTLFVCTTANAYPDVVAQLAPHLRSDHHLILFSGKLCGSLEVQRGLERAGCAGVTVVETDALFACRLQSDHSIWVRGFKGWNLFSAPRRRQTLQVSALVKSFFPGLQPADNLIQRGLTDFGALAHALTVLVNLNAVDRQQPFLFYVDGFTEKTVVLLEQLEREYRALAEAYGTQLLEARLLLKRYYGCDTDSLLGAMRSVPNYRDSLAPNSLQTRYLTEDVACTLVPAQQLARRAGLETPVLDSVISLTSVLHGQNYAVSGRSLEKLGWADLSRQAILDWVNW